MAAHITDKTLLREQAILGTKDPFYLGAEIIGLSKDELPRPADEIGPYYKWLDRPRPKRMPKLQKWLRFWSTCRFTGKTYGLLVYFMCEILRNRNIRIIIQGEQKQNAVDSVNLMREWFEEPKFVQLYGHHESKLWLKHEFTSAQRDIARRDPTVRALGLDDPMQGKRCDINAWEDLVGETNYDSEEGLTKVEKRVAATMPLIVPGGRGYYICTRWSPYDLSTDGLTVTGEPGIVKQWKDHKNPKTFPAWECAGTRGYFGAYSQKGDEKFYPHAVEGKPLFPTILDEDEINRQRQIMGLQVFASQILNDPIPAGTQYFDEENIQHFIEIDELGQRNEALVGAVYFLAIDPASGKPKAGGKPRDSTTFCGGYVKWVENTPIGYVTDWVGGVWKPSKVEEMLFGIADRRKPRKIFVESNIGGEFIMSPWKDRARELGVFLPLVDNPASLHGTGKKVARIETMQGYYNMSQIYHEISLKNGKGEQEQLKWKPQGALHDDFIDNLAQWFLSATKKRYAPAGGGDAQKRRSGFARRQPRYASTGV